MTQESHDHPKRPGPLTRFRSWLLRDPHAEILQIRAEWAEYQLIFNDLLTRWSAKLAREAKIEKKRLARLHEATDAGPDHRDPPTPISQKAALRSRFAASVLSGTLFDAPRNGGQNVASDQNQPGQHAEP